MMDDHRIPLEELRARYQTDYTKGLTTAKATQLNAEFGNTIFLSSQPFSTFTLNTIIKMLKPTIYNFQTKKFFLLNGYFSFLYQLIRLKVLD